jgi:site-specific DNA-methyltransferase (adenine-specific)
MGKSWDYDVPKTEIWKEVLRVLKPGGHLLSFFGSRTYHRGVVQIEDAGFEIRDQIMWVYGSGFPKSHNIGNGLGTALKPAHEPIVVARKPITQTVAKNVLEHGTGALNIDDCRIETNSELDDPRLGGKGSWKTNKAAKKVYEGGYSGEEIESSPLGRWPANFIHDGSDEVVKSFPNTKVGVAVQRNGGGQKIGAGNDIYSGSKGLTREDVGYGDSGSAARFFYCAKASNSDREENNNHPTVKPTELMKYLCRLVTPLNGTVLDPFMGSGSTGKAAIQENFDFIGIEMSKEYFEIAQARIEHQKKNKLSTLETFFT